MLIGTISEQLRAPLLALMLLLAACGGGSHGGGIGGTGLVIGPIDTLGDTMTVDGITFDVSSARIRIDGDDVSADALKLGLVVTVEGDIDETEGMGTADDIESNTLVIGQAEAVSDNRRAIMVLGNKIAVRDSTVIDGIRINSDIVNRRLRVSGLVDADGSIRATRIEPGGGTVNTLSVTGFAQNVDVTNRTLEIRTVTIDFSEAQLNGRPREGALTRAVVQGRPTDGIAVAVEVTTAPERVVIDGSRRFRALGVFTRHIDRNNFIFNGRQPVYLTSKTEIVGPADLELGRNVLVAIEGVLTQEGVRIRRLRLVEKLSPVEAVEITDRLGNRPVYIVVE